MSAIKANITVSLNSGEPKEYKDVQYEGTIDRKIDDKEKESIARALSLKTTDIKSITLDSDEDDASQIKKKSLLNPVLLDSTSKELNTENTKECDKSVFDHEYWEMKIEKYTENETGKERRKMWFLSRTDPRSGYLAPTASDLWDMFVKRQPQSPKYSSVTVKEAPPIPFYFNEKITTINDTEKWNDGSLQMCKSALPDTDGNFRYFLFNPQDFLKLQPPDNKALFSPITTKDAQNEEDILKIINTADLIDGAYAVVSGNLAISSLPTYREKWKKVADWLEAGKPLPGADTFLIDPKMAKEYADGIRKALEEEKKEVDCGLGVGDGALVPVIYPFDKYPDDRTALENSGLVWKGNYCTGPKGEFSVSGRIAFEDLAPWVQTAKTIPDDRKQSLVDALNKAGEQEREQAKGVKNQNTEGRYINYGYLVLSILGTLFGVVGIYYTKRSLDMMKKQFGMDDTDKRTSLEKYGRDLTDLARKKELKPLIGRTDELMALRQALANPITGNAILVGPPGSGKTQIVEGLAQLIVKTTDQFETIVEKLKASGTPERKILEEAKKEMERQLLESIKDKLKTDGVPKEEIDKKAKEQLKAEATMEFLPSKAFPNGTAVKEILLTSLMSGTKFRGELEERLVAIQGDLKKTGMSQEKAEQEAKKELAKQVAKEIIKTIRSESTKYQGKRVLIFIDEIHMAKLNRSGIMDYLKPLLSRSGINLIGATTGPEYKLFLQLDARDPQSGNDIALERRFNRIDISPLSKDQTADILKAEKSKKFYQDKSIERGGDVWVTDGAVDKAIELAEQFVPNEFFPAKAEKLLGIAIGNATIDNLGQCVELTPEMVEEAWVTSQGTTQEALSLELQLREEMRMESEAAQTEARRTLIRESLKKIVKDEKQIAKEDAPKVLEKLPSIVEAYETLWENLDPAEKKVYTKTENDYVEGTIPDRFLRRKFKEVWENVREADDLASLSNPPEITPVEEDESSEILSVDEDTGTTPKTTGDNLSLVDPPSDAAPSEAKSSITSLWDERTKRISIHPDKLLLAIHETGNAELKTSFENLFPEAKKISSIGDLFYQMESKKPGLVGKITLKMLTANAKIMMASPERLVSEIVLTACEQEMVSRGELLTEKDTTRRGLAKVIEETLEDKDTGLSPEDKVRPEGRETTIGEEDPPEGR